jgi:hypothetical protein
MPARSTGQVVLSALEALFAHPFFGTPKTAKKHQSYKVFQRRTFILSIAIFLYINPLKKLRAGA